MDHEDSGARRRRGGCGKGHPAAREEDGAARGGEEGFGAMDPLIFVVLLLRHRRVAPKVLRRSAAFAAVSRRHLALWKKGSAPAGSLESAKEILKRMEKNMQ